MYVVEWDGIKLYKSADYQKAMDKYIEASNKYKFVELRETGDNGNSGKTICQSW